MSTRSPFVNSVIDRLNQVTPAIARAMFGGYGIYAEGVMFGLIANDVLYLKVDSHNQADYVAAGSPPFEYDRNGKLIQMSYYRLPETIWDDVAQLAVWVEAAQGAARRSKSKTSKSKTSKSKTSKSKPPEKI